MELLVHLRRIRYRYDTISRSMNPAKSVVLTKVRHADQNSAWVKRQQEWDSNHPTFSQLYCSFPSTRLLLKVFVIIVSKCNMRPKTIVLLGNPRKWHPCLKYKFLSCFLSWLRNLSRRRLSTHSSISLWKTLVLHMEMLEKLDTMLVSWSVHLPLPEMLSPPDLIIGICLLLRWMYNSVPMGSPFRSNRSKTSSPSRAPGSRPFSFYLRHFEKLLDPLDCALCSGRFQRKHGLVRWVHLTSGLVLSRHFRCHKNHDVWGWLMYTESDENSAYFLI